MNAAKDCNSSSKKLSFSKNKKLNFIFGGNIKASGHRFSQDSTNVITPRVNAVPIISVNLESQDQLHESKYKKVNMEIETNRDDQEKELKEMKAQLNKIAKEMQNKPINLYEKSQTKENSEDFKNKYCEVITRFIKKLSEYKQIYKK